MAPWDLVDRPLFWHDAALLRRSIERDVQAMQQRQASRGVR